jgi:two-component system, chemotaxis family, chemotaxis protein CheY
VQIDVDTRKHGVGKTVLVVDDNAAVRKMIAGAFLSDGFATCGEAENGREGIELAKELHPDLITLDVSMPVMNGLAAATELRKLYPKTPIILFTLFGDGQMQSEATKIGVNLVLSKTTPLKHVVVLAHRLLGMMD